MTELVPFATLRLDQTLREAGIAIVGVNSLGQVTPSALQASAQPIIDAFVAAEAPPPEQLAAAAAMRLVDQPDPYVVLLLAALDVALAELATAVPKYTMPSPEQLKTNIREVLMAQVPPPPPPVTDPKASKRRLKAK